MKSKNRAIIALTLFILFTLTTNSRAQSTGENKKFWLECAHSELNYSNQCSEKTYIKYGIDTKNKIVEVYDYTGQKYQITSLTNIAIVFGGKIKMTSGSDGSSQITIGRKLGDYHAVYDYGDGVGFSKDDPDKIKKIILTGSCKRISTPKPIF